MVEIYTPFIKRWAQRNGIQPADADDISQEVLADVLRRLPEFEHSGRTGAFRRWLGIIVFHRIVDFWRSRKDRQIELAPPDLLSLEDPASELSREWDAEHDLHVMQRLLALVEPEFTETTWQAFRRQAIDNIRPADVAAGLGVSVNAVLLAKFRVLKRLREESSGMID